MKKKPFWWGFLKRRRRKKKPQTGLVVRPVPKNHMTEPERWIPPFATTKRGKVDKQNLVVVRDPNGFDLGKITATVGIVLQARIDCTFQMFVDDCLERFKNLDWGGMNEDERRINDRRITTGTGTVYGNYTDLTSGIQIWIATDLDQSITRICLSEER